MSQIYNPNTQMFIKKDKDGKFTSAKPTPYKNAKLETATKQNKKNNTIKNKK